MKPVDIVKKYKEEEYDMIAITDHDVVSGVNEAVIAGEAVQLGIVPGIEIAANYEGVKELHILGYYIDIEDENLLDFCDQLMEWRSERNQALMDYLKEQGYEITKDDLKKVAGRRSFVGKPHFAKALVEKGCPEKDTWTLLEAVPKKKADAYEVMDVIKAAKGIAVLAHPMQVKFEVEGGYLQGTKCSEAEKDEFFSKLDVMLRDLKKHGLKGLECYHPSAANEDSLRLVALAEKYHLHITEGSDFHGTNK